MERIVKGQSWKYSFFGLGPKKRKISRTDSLALDNARNGLKFAAIVENHRQHV